jgi:hypothetical protein
MKYPKRSQYQYAKSPYRIRNWPEYEAGLCRRGDLTVWLSDDAVNSWRAPPSGKPGGQRTYANIAIEAALTIRMVFQLPLRQTEGFLRSLAEMLEVEIPIPDHTTLSRRLKTLGELSFRAVTSHRPIHLFIDSSGLRIHVGNLRKPPKNRAWRKLHQRPAFENQSSSGSCAIAPGPQSCSWGVHRTCPSTSGLTGRRSL